jgi:hypothetical protein
MIEECKYFNLKSKLAKGIARIPIVLILSNHLSLWKRGL